MHIDLHEKVAIVTGASRGIGRAIARTLHRHGASLMVSSRNEEALAVLCSDLLQEERLAAQLQSATNIILGRRGAKLLLGTVMIV